MKLTILGKFGPYPAAGGGTSSYLLQSGNSALMLDFGSGALARLSARLSPSALDAVVLSHLHNDHICDLLPLGYYLEANKASMRVVAPDTDCPQNTFLHSIGGLSFVPPQEMQIGAFSLSFCKMQHPLESYAVKIRADGRTLLYSGDTSFCPQLVEFARGCDLLLLDCGKPENSSAPHLSPGEAAYLAKTLCVPVIASHLHPALRYVSPSPVVAIAEEGKTYSV